MSRVTFLPDQISIVVAPGTTILAAARLAGVLIEAPCNGAGHCGKCAVRVAPEQVAAVTIPPGQQLPPEREAAGWILACHAEVRGEVTVHVPTRTESGLQIITTGQKRRTVALSPWISKRFDPETDQTFVSAGERLLTVERGDTAAEVCGVVVDIGTTTLVVALVDLLTGKELASASALNPQSLHAQDVLSRIRFSAAPGGLAQLQRELIAELNRLIAGLTATAGVSRAWIYEAVFSGNTCMLHLAAGVDPAPLGKYPFTPTLTGGNHLAAADLGLAIAAAGLVYLPPVISAYVGADITAGILAAELNELTGTTLFIDIGTNGEMILASDGLLAATSTAAGPAFEGMNISCGMRAAAGAIEEVRITAAGEVALEVIGNGEATGICGSGLMDLVAELVGSGVIGATGKFTAAERLPAPLGTRIEKENGSTQFRVTETVSLSQKDVRQVQLAKGAIRAGIDILLDERGVTAVELDRVFIAGSFGFHLREESLLTLGLLPPETAGKVSFLGNTSQSGGELLLLSDRLRVELEALTADVERVELTGRADFDRIFMKAMGF